jgi:hypothetical protein
MKTRRPPRSLGQCAPAIGTGSVLVGTAIGAVWPGGRSYRAAFTRFGAPVIGHLLDIYQAVAGAMYDSGPIAARPLRGAG